jgi:hypothetical protein
MSSRWLRWAPELLGAAIVAVIVLGVANIGVGYLVNGRDIDARDRYVDELFAFTMPTLADPYYSNEAWVAWRVQKRCTPAGQAIWRRRPGPRSALAFWATYDAKGDLEDRATSGPVWAGMFREQGESSAELDRWIETIKAQIHRDAEAVLAGGDRYLRSRSCRTAPAARTRPTGRRLSGSTTTGAASPAAPRWNDLTAAELLVTARALDAIADRELSADERAAVGRLRSSIVREVQDRATSSPAETER